MAPRVSVVIPVYNVGKQLETCLQSVVGQTFTDLEIVVVNDGSTDDSPQIVARFARQDPRIVIIDRPNEGVAYARKHGVEAARGEYIQYLDGDDFLEPDAIELYPQLQRRFYADKPTYRQVEKALANVELGAIVLLLSKRWFGEARRLALRAQEIEKQFPGLLHQRPARHYRRLLKAYARSEFMGKLMARYYLLTRKIK